MVAPTRVYEVDEWFFSYPYLQSCLAVKPVTEFARILDEAKVPNVLWGEHALALCGSVARDDWFNVSFAFLLFQN